MSAAIFALTLACYWPALHGGLLWDDAAHVTRPELRSLAGLGRIWSDAHATQQYYPILHTAFWLEHRLWGDTTLGYHLVNGVFHATSACFFAVVLRRLWSRPAVPPGAIAARPIPPGTEWLAAALFAVHPVGVESVAWISEQKNTLSLVFYLLAALAYFNFDALRHRRSYMLGLSLFLLAVATKSVTATLPAALLLLGWWKNGAVSWRRDLVPLLPWFGVALAAGAFTVWVERNLIGAQGAAFDLSTGQRFQLAGRAIWFYVGKLFWPSDLMFVYRRWDLAAASPLQYGWLAAAVALTVALWLVRRHTRGPLTAWLFFAGSLFPALGFFNVYPFLFSYVADHFQYLASLGLIALVAAGAGRGMAVTSRLARIAAGIFSGLVVVVLAALAHHQSQIYRDSDTLYRTTLARNPDCWMAHNNLGAELAKSPAHVAEAMAHYQQALRLKPDDPEVHNNLGNALALQPGGESAAIAHFERALQLAPGFVEAELNLANTLAKMPGRTTAAFDHYRAALRLDPHNAEVHYCLANVLATLPEGLPEAAREYAATLRLRPDYAEAHANFAVVLARLPGREPEALAHYTESLRLNPALPKTHYNLAALLESLPGRETEVVLHYEEALRLNPDYAEAHNNLAIVYARAGRLADARRHWLAALKLNPNYEDARKNLRLLEQLEPR
jgi:protein O-mannosyl-transferase